MFDASGAHSGGYLQCVVLLKILVSAICIFATSGAKFVCYLQCFLLLEPMWHAICHVYWFTGLPEARTGQKNIGGAPDKKIAPDKKSIRGIGAGRWRIVFQDPRTGEKNSTGEKKILGARAPDRAPDEKKVLQTDTGRAAETEFIENHWKTNGFHCFGAKMIEIQMVFQRFVEETIENH